VAALPSSAQRYGAQGTYTVYYEETIQGPMTGLDGIYTPSRWVRPCSEPCGRADRDVVGSALSTSAQKRAETAPHATRVGVVEVNGSQLGRIG